MDQEQSPRQRVVRIGTIEVGNDRPFVLIAGPCAIESRSHAMEVADALRALGYEPVWKDWDAAMRAEMAEI